VTRTKYMRATNKSLPAVGKVSNETCSSQSTKCFRSEFAPQQKGEQAERPVESLQLTECRSNAQRQETERRRRTSTRFTFWRLTERRAGRSPTPSPEPPPPPANACVSGGARAFDTLRTARELNWPPVHRFEDRRRDESFVFAPPLLRNVSGVLRLRNAHNTKGEWVQSALVYVSS
jgi:hypothetical protein